MSNIKKLMMTAASAGGGLNVENVFYATPFLGRNAWHPRVPGVPLTNVGAGSSTKFDGSNDYLTRGSFSGEADGKTFTFSAWIKFDDDADSAVFSSDTNGGGNGFNVLMQGRYLNIYGYASNGSASFSLRVDRDSVPIGRFFHLLVSGDCASAARKVRIDDIVPTIYQQSSNNADIDFTRGINRIGVRYTDYKFDGNLAHVYLDYTYRDLDTESNRRLFITSDYASTSTSTLTALNPIMYVPLTSDYTVGKNLGTGGDFTLNSSPAIDTTLGTDIDPDIDPSAVGGLVWTKNRDDATDHIFTDTETFRQAKVGAYVSTSDTYGNQPQKTDRTFIQGFTKTGWAPGKSSSTNSTNQDMAAWVFRKAPKFFTVVTYTGNGSTNGHTISHDLGTDVGFMVIKRLDTYGNFWCWHRGFATNYKIGRLNDDDAFGNDNGSYFGGNNGPGHVAPTSTNFMVGGHGDVNASGGEYVAYIWAHNDSNGDFGVNGDQDIIKCGGYTGGSGNTEITLGFEPQFLLIKRVDATENWLVADTTRGLPNTGDDVYTQGFAELLVDWGSYAEATPSYCGVTPLSTGFKVRSGLDALYSTNGGKYIYVAIRKGDMGIPTSSEGVFNVKSQTPIQSATPTNVSQDMRVDLLLQAQHTHANLPQTYLWDRSRGHRTNFRTDSTAADDVRNNDYYPYMDYYDRIRDNWSYGAGSVPNDMVYWTWKQAAGYFDIVCYDGTGSVRTVAHNLTVAPEMMWVKRRNSVGGGLVYHSALADSENLQLFGNGSDAKFTYTGNWNSTDPTETVFTLGVNGNVNGSGDRFIAYLFATAPGVSKVGSYTGNGSNQTIDCGFSSGAKFVLIKRVSGTGNWYIVDTARGIVSGNDPYLNLNSGSAEVSSEDIVDPASSGFIVNQTGGAEINISGDTYIFYAIAAA